MGRLVDGLLAIDKTVSHRALDCGLGLGGLNNVDGPNHPSPFA